MMEIPVYTPELTKEFPTDDKNKSFFTQARKLLSISSKGISPLERLAIKKAGNEVGQKHSLVQLQQDLLNVLYNVFGCHGYLLFSVSSNTKDENEDNNVKIIDQRGLLTEIKEVIDPLVQKSDLLAYNKTTNQAEQYNIRQITHFNRQVAKVSSTNSNLVFIDTSNLFMSLVAVLYRRIADMIYLADIDNRPIPT
ncbi:hypothetical protein ILUMI_00181 [Ignelater luminosus]|uniref:Uncharacterized protein n=1 Tax=Ignelater luminosus TaxID=2038154 RepID=A0A8K0DT47_IGNLU|nr:hypothetical protein ILUMI_00181 [Ignelater luminosus]